ncbi:MAG: hydrolase [Sphingomonadales bacterium]|nr:hydrolase [Sphingomonadales bacterium]
MTTIAMGNINPVLGNQCPAAPVPANAQDLPIQIVEVGEEGPVVMFVHGGVQGGIGGGPPNFDGQKPLADKGWHLKFLARPGFGDSPSRGPDDMEADADLIASVMGDTVHLLGHSFGGGSAMLAAALRPEAVRSLILVEPALQMMLSTDPEAAADPASREAADIIMKSLQLADTPANYAIAFLGSLGSDLKGDDNYIAAQLKADPVYATMLGCSLLRARMASPQDLRAAADTIVAAGIPVLVITGGYSPGQEATGRAVARLTGGRHIVVSAPSHFLQQDCPAAFNDAVDAFLREVTDSSRHN